ncbi:disulfide bond formation protein B [Pseudooceanicola onchidii]|uniref:disulfide bond formation protein B n=1 Tax=Pseudooceanicola onchidii TaxID=2562279 RepID=UPI0010A9DF5D|nr:disulfide bond formation protein B [Pseudooceanicola onchidii]
MTFRTHILIAAGGSAALLLGALFFQYVLGLAPCTLCIWQRWPHLAAVLIGVAAYALGLRALAFLGAGAAALSGVFGIYHTGVERNWWEGPTTCTSSSPGSVSADELFNQIMNAPLIRCDEVAWSLLGLSMASWNAILAFALAVVWLRAALMPRP